MEIPQYLINWGLGSIATVAGWFLRQLWDAHKALAAEVSEMKLDVAKHYTPNDRFESTVAAMFTKLDRIEDLLRDKVDKSR